jgi:hypothetical protein
MGVKHTYTSPTADGGNPSGQVDSNDWNDDHEIDGDVDFAGHSLTNVTNINGAPYVVGIGEVSDDTSPTLGGSLDGGGFDITNVDDATFDTLTVTDDAYAVGWNGSALVPTKNAVYDKIEAVLGTTLPAAYQPLDSDLTSIAALATAAYGRGLLTLAADTDLADEVGPLLLGNVANVKHPDYGAVGDGITDDTQAFQDAVDSGFAEIFVPDGDYLLTDNILLAETVKLFRCSPGATILHAATGPLFYKVGVIGGLKTVAATVDAGARQVTLVDASAVVVGDWFWFKSTDLSPNVTAGQRNAFMRRVMAKSGNVVDFDAALPYDYTTSLAYRTLVLGGRIVFEGGTYTANDQDTHFSSFFSFLHCHAPDFNGITITGGGGPGIVLDNCIGGSFNDSHIYDLLDDTGASHFGYGISLAGCCRGFRVNSGSIGKCRHGITTTGISEFWDAGTLATIEGFGEPEDIYVGPVYIYSCTQAGIDTHEQGYRWLVTPNVHGCYWGVQTRCNDMTIMGGQIVGCRRRAITLGPPTGSPDTTFTNKLFIIGTTIRHVATEDGDAQGINFGLAGAEVIIRDVQIIVEFAIGVDIRVDARADIDGLVIDGLVAGAQVGINLESDDNLIRNTTIRNCDVGIVEATGLTGNLWYNVDYIGNNTNEDRTPTYALDYRPGPQTTVPGLGLIEKSADPDDPAEGEAIIWRSDGTGAGFDGDIMAKTTFGAATTTLTLGSVATPRVVTAAGGVTIGANDSYVALNKTIGEATAVTLGAASSKSGAVTIKDRKGDANTNNITITRDGSDTIDGATTYVIDFDYGAVTLTPHATGWDVA